MQVDDFNFELPENLIAQQPLSTRSASRLLFLDGKSGELQHRQFCEIESFLLPGDLLIFNNTRVIKARLFGEKNTGGKIEILVERVIDDFSALCHVKANKKIKIGLEINLITSHQSLCDAEQLKKQEDGVKITVIAKQDDLFVLQFPVNKMTIWEILDKYGHIPLPPYITRGDAALDAERYQSIFAQHAGAVAAPTASLHFDEELIVKIKNRGVDLAFITLHVGAGTFQPVRVTEIEMHKMHSEYMDISAETCAKIKVTKERGGRVIAVGTTCVRCLETAAQRSKTKGIDELQPWRGETNIFIYPGYEFNCVDVIVTNFHLPKSTLLMLVCAFAGYGKVMLAYEEAVRLQYRFFSYGDAMLIMRE